MHKIEYDKNNKPIADRKYDENGTLVGEGIYKDGELVGHKKYVMHQGYRHEIEYDKNNKPVADRKYDENGTLVGEGIYKNGAFVGHKEYSKPQDKKLSDSIKRQMMLNKQFNR